MNEEVKIYVTKMKVEDINDFMLSIINALNDNMISVDKIVYNGKVHFEKKEGFKNNG